VRQLNLPGAEVLVIAASDIASDLMERVDTFKPHLVLLDSANWALLFRNRLSYAELRPSVRRRSMALPRKRARNLERLNDVVSFVTAGLTNREIAAILGVSTRTVKAYLQELFTIFDVSNRTELVSAALGSNLVVLDRDEHIRPNGQNRQS
jgi:DNA-binding NarL/FixJ family response regulator